MNLVQELGVDYMRDRFGGCMFYNADKTPCYIEAGDTWANGKIRVKVVSGTPENAVGKSLQVPYDFFSDLSVFSVPPLGWRTAEDGCYLAHFRRNNKSYQRAVAPKVLLRTLSPATQFLVDTDNVSEHKYANPEALTALIMLPKYLPFREGLEAMRKGDLFSFCVNPNVAVIPNVGKTQALYFNMTKVGVVNTAGEVVIPDTNISALVKDILQ